MQGEIVNSSLCGARYKAEAEMEIYGTGSLTSRFTGPGRGCESTC